MANEGKDRRGRWEGFNLGNSGGGNGGQPPTRSPWRFSLVYILIALAILLLVANPFGRQQREVSLNLFYSQIRQGTVKEVDLSPTSIGWITSDNTRFSTALPPQFQTNELVNQLRDEG